MIKTSIGELKLSPIKEEGKFLFFNDFVTINGKISKGDKISIYVAGYELVNDSYVIKPKGTATAVLIVRGKKVEHKDTDGYTNVEDYYKVVSELYKSQFYFGNKVNNTL